MSASTGPVIFRLFLIPGRLYGTDVAESAHGICTTPLAALAWSGVSGASLAPKSTVRALIDAMPPPEPIGEYATCTPDFELQSLTHSAISGAGKVAPAPVRLSSVERLDVAPATPATT